MHTPEAYREYKIKKLIEHGIYQKKANVKPCYTDTGSQFNVTVRPETGKDKQLPLSTFFIYLLTEKSNSKWVSN